MVPNNFILPQPLAQGQRNLLASACGILVTPILILYYAFLYSLLDFYKSMTSNIFYY